MIVKQINFKLFRWHIYIDINQANPARRKKCKRSRITCRIQSVRNSRYRQKKGCCELCGHHFEKGQLQMHHILPFAYFPKWKLKKWNLMMLCPRCHNMIHNNPVLQVETMQRTAYAKGIDLKRKFSQAIAARWEMEHPLLSNS